MFRSHRRIIEQQVIIPESLDLHVGESKLTGCPFCKVKHENRFSITRIEQGLLYNCYRATCGAKGFISSMPGTTQLECSTFKKKFKPKEFKYLLEELPERVLDSLYDKYELTEEEIHAQGFKWVPEQDRIWMPLFDRRNRVWGSQTKTYGEGAGGPKTIVYQTSEGSRLHYVHEGERRGRQVAVVEDILSAIKISRCVRGVALLGTSLHEQQLAELREEADNIILMLDPDMYQKMLNYKRKYSFYFRNFSVVLLSKDVKDTPQTELEEIIGPLAQR